MQYLRIIIFTMIIKMFLLEDWVSTDNNKNSWTVIYIS